MKKRAPRTLLDYAIARGGYRKGVRVGIFVAQWLIAQRSLGHEPTVEQAADWWKESHATWYRRQSDFRELFPGQVNPSAICRDLIEQNERKLSQSDLGLVLGWLGSIEHGVAVT